MLLIGAGICGVIAWSAAPALAPAQPVVAAVVGAGWVARDRLRAPRTVLRRPWMTVAGASLALFALVAIGTLDLLVWSPQAMAPGYSLDEIYAALTPVDRAYGITMALIWTGFWGVVALGYLLVGTASARRPRPGTRRSLLLIAATIVSVAILLQWWAGFSLGNSISDALPPFSGARTEVSGLLGVIGQLCLSGAILGWVGPGRSPLPATTAPLATP